MSGSQLAGAISDAVAAASAAANSSAKSDGVSTLDATFTNDPPTLADLQAVQMKLNELIVALRR